MWVGSLWSLLKRLLQRSGLPTPAYGLVTVGGRGLTAPSPDGDPRAPSCLFPYPLHHHRSEGSAPPRRTPGRAQWHRGCVNLVATPRPCRRSSASAAAPRPAPPSHAAVPRAAGLRRACVLPACRPLVQAGCPRISIAGAASPQAAPHLVQAADVARAGRVARGGDLARLPRLHAPRDDVMRPVGRGRRRRSGSAPPPPAQAMHT